MAYWLESVIVGLERNRAGHADSVRNISSSASVPVGAEPTGTASGEVVIVLTYALHKVHTMAAQYGGTPSVGLPYRHCPPTTV